MDFYIPKFGKELYVKDGSPGIKTGVKGEYRAKLYGVDGRLKSDTGWKPNTLLDQGLMYMRNTDFFVRMNLGTSNTPVDITQVGLQGSYLGYATFGTVTYAANNGAPFYEKVSIEKVTFISGTGTGTINEFTCSPNNSNYTTNAGVRVVLDAPIIKGPQDELTIEHRLTFYPQLTDAVGVITIGGDSPADYNYIVRHVQVQYPPLRHFEYIQPPYWGNMNAGNEELTGITDAPAWANRYVGGSTLSIGGSGPGTWYAANDIFWGVNSELNGYVLRTMRGGVVGYAHNNGTFGMQMRIGKVSDDSGILKLNTHEIHLGWRTFPMRYVP